MPDLRCHRCGSPIEEPVAQGDRTVIAHVDREACFRALRARAERAEKVAAIVDENEGCCGPGEWCHFKTYSELAVDYVDDCERRYREGQRAALRAAADWFEGATQLSPNAVSNRLREMAEATRP